MFGRFLYKSSMYLMILSIFLYNISTWCFSYFYVGNFSLLLRALSLVLHDFSFLTLSSRPLSFLGLTKTDAVRGAQVKYYEAYE